MHKSVNRAVLPDLLSFVAVVSAGTFTAAGSQLGISHSVLSKRIKRLEAKLGIQLLNRTTRQLHLTEAGERVFRECEQIKENIEGIILELGQLQEEPQGILRVHAPMSFGQLHLAQAVSDFIQRYPKIQIELILGNSTINLLENGIDVGIFIKELPDSSLIARRIGLRRMHVCGSPEYFAKHGMPKTPDDLSSHNCLLYQLQPQTQKWLFNSPAGDSWVKVSGNLRMNSSQALAHAAVSGLGIVKLPGYMVTREIQSGKLISILKQYCPKDIGIYATYPHTKYPNKKVKVFIDFLADRFSGEKYWNEE